MCTKYIAPAIENAGWDKMTQMREEFYFTDGPIHVQGTKTKRGTGKKADYILYYKPDIPLAVVEAKDNNKTVAAGMQQALEYADILDIPFVFSSNGDAFQFHDRTQTGTELESEIGLDEFPSPEHLFRRYCRWKELTPEQSEVVGQNYYVDPGGKRPRYYQQIAINRTVEAIAKGEDRILLLMATGTGKTYTAFQILWRLWKAGVKQRILFLADRNVLVDQTMVGDFKPFKGAMAKISQRSKTIERQDGSNEELELAYQRGKINKSYEIYLSLYQAITGPEEARKVYKQFSPDFFDLIVIDECHRGSARDDSEWREILNYFSSASQIGLTATPKETEEVSNSNYFGDPVFKYTLKQGIADGFLAPYKVIRVRFDKDAEWRPKKGQKDDKGRLIPDRQYGKEDWDKNTVMTDRNLKVAKRVVEFLEKSDPYSKTIIFCEDIAHADRMRIAITNLASNRVLENKNYVVKITGDDKIGKRELDNFIHPESRYPVIATTSKLLSTGVDAKTCKLIVLDREIDSTIEFKQIIGRGTRIDEEFDKTFFTIMDFRNATRKFADEDFDGYPVQILEVTDGEDIDPHEESPQIQDESDNDTEVGPAPGLEFPMTVGEGNGTSQKYVISNETFEILDERVQFIGTDGKLQTESFRDFTRNRVTGKFATLEQFINYWSANEQKSVIIEELETQGVFFDMLSESVGKEFGPFDLICHIAYDQPPMTRRERAENVKKRNYFGKYGEQARSVLEALVEKYANQGIRAIEDLEVLNVQPFDQMGSLVEIISFFGSKDEYEKAIKELASILYETAA